MIYRITIKFLVLWCCIAFPAMAQFSGLGSAKFENSGAPEAQEAFYRGLLLLHSFEYEDAREAFVEAREIDPDFAMAYWGEAMTYNHPIWMLQETEEGRAALIRLASDSEGRLAKASTERERGYLRAIEALYFSHEGKEERDRNYEKQMGMLAEQYPEDMEAASFHALAILGLAHDGRDYTLYMRAAAIVEEVFAQNPEHPGATHYLIHAYDDPVHAPLGLRAARVYAQIAPEAAHALHMPSHIFTALGMWPEMAAANEASFAASDARMHRKGLGVHARSFHSRHWLAYAYFQQGRFEEAQGLIEDMKDDVDASGDSKRTRNYAVRMLASHLTETQDWNSEHARWEIDRQGMNPVSMANILFIQGKVALVSGNEQRAREALKELMNIEDKEHVSDLLEHQLKAELLMWEGNLDGAIELLSIAAQMDAERPLDYGPPMPAKPTFELLGEYYLKAERGAEAMKAFKASLGRAPGRSLSFIGIAKAAKMESDKKAYEKAMTRLKENWQQADPEVSRMFSESHD